MEAASARYAARDRFAYPTQPATTQLQRFIQNACSPENFEPNLALCLEVADMINSKGAGAPREAAVAIIGYVNHRNPNVSMLALALLDMCVKNCGYPFHLQISTKEFLNELVRRFPERPPLRTTRVQTRILELIEEWRRTICETSKYKDDLGLIRDMHRLLAMKGYAFPEIRREDAAVLNPSDNLKSAEEMEAEERAAQSAKLQELIRRGTPADLQEANRLMKVMAGYDTRHRTDYRAKAAEEVSKIQQKAKLLEEMLQGHQAGEEIKDGDVFEELANALASAHPKIQRMCEEESEDTEAVAKLLEINDSIHRTVERYKLVKKGDVEGAKAIPRGTLGVSGAGVTKGPDNELSLIDFGGLEDAEAASNQQPSAQADMLGTGSEVRQSKAKGSSLEDDLLGLNMGDGNYGQGGGISLGGPSNGTTVRTSTADIMAQFNQPVQQSSASHSSFGNASTQMLSTSNYGNVNPLPSTAPTSSQQPSKPATPAPASLQLHNQSLHQQKKSDPFASLTTPSRGNSPFQYQQSTKAHVDSQPSQAPTGSIDLLGMGSNGASAPQHAHNDDEWTFSSALPDQPVELQVTNSAINTVFVTKRSSDSEILIESYISNTTAQPIAELTFQLAVTKGYTLQLQPQSSRTLSPHQRRGITQTIRLQGVERGNGAKVRMRWRAGYLLGGEQRHEQGEIAGLGVS